MDAPTVTIGKVTATLVKPRATLVLALTRSEEDVEGATQEVATLIGCAALAACWPTDTAWPVNARPARWVPGQPVETYGALVFDDLVEFGIPMLDLLGSADGDGPLTIAHRWALFSRLKSDEVRAVEDFSEAPPGA